ncbi:MAG TPA: thioredoxin domain-containing protein [Polyangiaceae bacterium]|nr:thioredoxin domain-containing protein [Polyangiaceae bacterium]
MSNAFPFAAGLSLGFLACVSTGCRDSSASSAGAAASATATATAEVKEIVLDGVDTSPMTPRERRVWSSLVTELLAPCPSVPVPVAQCVQEKRACGSCTQAAKWVARAVREGAPEDQIKRAYKDRFDPSGVKPLPVDGSPTRGPDDAQVTVVEFADFECPHCRDAVPMIDAVLAAHPGKVRLVYKTFTLPFHVHGEGAARAAFAAGLQGKFWEMEHLLFERQDHLEDADLERYAQMLKLDVPKWKADADSAPIKDRLAKDHRMGEDLKLKGTPTIYVNGRELEVEQDEPLEDRVAAELGLAPAQRRAQDAGAGPAASAAAGGR